jgi:diguanylate cyclase (GGDEF)-like protein
MTAWLRRLSIIAFILAIVAALVLALLREVQIKRMDRDEKAVAMAARAISSLSTLRYHASQLRAIEAAYALTGNKALFDSYRKSADVITWETKNLEAQRAVSAGVARHFSTLSPKGEELVRHATQLMQLAERTDFATAGSAAAEHVAKRSEDDYISMLYRAEIDLIAERDAKRTSFDTNAGLLGPWPTILMISAFALGFIGIALAVAPAAVAPREASAELVLESQDAVTRLPTRQYLRMALQRATAANQKANTYSAVVLADIVSFRKVNERFGFDLGDQLLRKLADRALRQIRQGDTVARMPGDEFAVVVFRSSRAELDAFIAGLQGELQRPCRLGEEAVRVNVCVGAGFAPDDGKDAEKLLELAGERLKEAQKTVRRGIKVFRRAPGQNTSEMEAAGPISQEQPRSAEDVDRPRAPVRAAALAATAGAAAGVVAGAAAAGVAATAAAKVATPRAPAPNPFAVAPFADTRAGAPDFAIGSAELAANTVPAETSKAAFPGIADLLADVQKTVKLDTPLAQAAPPMPSMSAVAATSPTGVASDATSADIKAIYEAELMRYLGNDTAVPAPAMAAPAAPAAAASLADSSARASHDAMNPPPAPVSPTSADSTPEDSVESLLAQLSGTPAAAASPPPDPHAPMDFDLGLPAAANPAASAGDFSSHDLELSSPSGFANSIDIPPLEFESSKTSGEPVNESASRAEALLSRAAEATMQLPAFEPETFDPERTLVLPPRQPS